MTGTGSTPITNLIGLNHQSKPVEPNRAEPPTEPPVKVVLELVLHDSGVKLNQTEPPTEPRGSARFPEPPTEPPETKGLQDCTLLSGN